MGKRKERKLKQQMEDKARRVPLPDLLDDLDREQIEPAEAPAEEAHETWDDKWEWDGRPETRTGGSHWNDKKNGKE